MKGILATIILSQFVAAYTPHSVGAVAGSRQPTSTHEVATQDAERLPTYREGDYWRWNKVDYDDSPLGVKRYDSWDKVEISDEQVREDGYRYLTVTWTTLNPSKILESGGMENTPVEPIIQEHIAQDLQSGDLWETAPYTPLNGYDAPADTAGETYPRKICTSSDLSRLPFDLNFCPFDRSRIPSKEDDDVVDCALGKVQCSHFLFHDHMDSAGVDVQHQWWFNHTIGQIVSYRTTENMTVDGTTYTSYTEMVLQSTNVPRSPANLDAGGQ